MKKVLLGVVFSSLLSMAYANDEPFSISKDLEYNNFLNDYISVMQITARDNIQVKDIVLNRGNCELRHKSNDRADFINKQREILKKKEEEALKDALETFGERYIKISDLQNVVNQSSNTDEFYEKFNRLYNQLKTKNNTYSYKEFKRWSNVLALKEYFSLKEHLTNNTFPEYKGKKITEAVKYKQDWNNLTFVFPSQLKFAEKLIIENRDLTCSIDELLEIKLITDKGEFSYGVD